jgi:hypothetical protein
MLGVALKQFKHLLAMPFIINRFIQRIIEARGLRKHA